MTIVQVLTPLLPESIQKGVVARWLKKLGDYVERGEPLVELETDKIILEVPSPTGGLVHSIQALTGAEVLPSQLLAEIEEGPKPQIVFTQEPIAQAATQKVIVEAVQPQNVRASPLQEEAPHLSPSQRLEVFEKGEELMESDEKRVRMSPIRQTIAKRLLMVCQNTAMLTTFNDINMNEIVRLRSDYKDSFFQEHGVKLGYMGFFIKAMCESIKHYPLINAFLEGEDIVYHKKVHMSVAVSTDKGLVVPVLRHVDAMTVAEIETSLAHMAQKAREGRLTLDDLEGGTCTITNGGSFGSLLSTPLINPPQSAILGMHRVEERPIVDKGLITRAAMMYVAVSYDHRLIDGKEAVGFLQRVKDILENPERLILD